MTVISVWTGREARLLREALRLSQRQFAAALGIAARTVAQWDRVGVGITPRPEFQQMLDVALDRAPDRAVSRFEEAVRQARESTSRDAGGHDGLDPNHHPPLATNSSYPATRSAAVDSVTGLWRLDLLDTGWLMKVGVEPRSWDEASLRWLVAPPDGPASRTAAPVRVGLPDVEAVVTTVEVFAKLDNTFGGNHARRSLIQFLDTHVRPLLQGRYDESTGRALHRAVAEATLLAGWMSYDAGHHGLAQRYLLNALRLAQAAGDAQLAGSVLSAMSHQATFLGHYREALDLAQAAVAGTRTVTTATLTAQFLAMQGRAFAGLGERRRCELALVEAERTFERRHPSADPAFITYFTESELAAEVGHCMRDLGRADAAASSIQLSLEGSVNEYVRSDFFATVVLADAQLDQGEPELACGTMLAALALGRQLRSVRSVAYVSGFRRRLERFAATTAATEIAERAADSPLWLAAA